MYTQQQHCVAPTPVTAQELAASLIRLYGVLLDSPEGYASDLPKVTTQLTVVVHHLSFFFGTASGVSYPLSLTVVLYAAAAASVPLILRLPLLQLQVLLPLLWRKCSGQRCMAVALKQQK
jgi:hypothetical protein